MTRLHWLLSSIPISKRSMGSYISAECGNVYLASNSELFSSFLGLGCLFSNTVSSIIENGASASKRRFFSPRWSTVGKESIRRSTRTCHTI